MITCQLPPLGDSDDKIYTTANSVVMLDGASAFLPVPVSPSEYAEALGGHLQGLLERSPAGDLRQTLAMAIHAVVDDLDLRPGCSPSSTVTIVRWLEDFLDVLVLGDNLVATPGQIITDERIDQLDLAPRRAYRQRLAEGHGFDATHHAILRTLQAQQAERRNREDGYWIAEAEPTAAEAAVVTRLPLSAAPWLVLATDGAYEPMRHLELDDWEHLATLDEVGLQRVLNRCQRWEAEVDPLARELPRAKPHDDKSLAVIRPDCYSG
nr:hypothetical protein [Kibdelosporangium sp. MJ126-NF4]